MTNNAVDTALSPVGGKVAPDLEKLPIADVLATLGSKPDQGLSGAEAQQRLGRYGPNALVEKEESLAAKILGHFTGPIAYMIEAAALVSAAIGHWEDFTIIAALLLFNVGLEMWQDRKATAALASTQEGPCSGGRRQARRQVADRAGRNARARRHRQDPPRRHRAGRSAGS